MIRKRSFSGLSEASCCLCSLANRKLRELAGLRWPTALEGGVVFVAKPRDVGSCSEPPETLLRAVCSDKDFAFELSAYQNKRKISGRAKAQPRLIKFCGVEQLYLLADGSELWSGCAISVSLGIQMSLR